MSETSTAHYKTPKVRRYTATVTVEVVEDVDSSWHPPFTEAQAKRLASDLVHTGFIQAGSYAAEVKRISIRKEVSHG